jgi:outer membrane lipoprotein-sorting protein
MNKIILAYCFFSFALTAQAQSVRATLDKMYQAVAAVKTFSYDMSSTERIGSRNVAKNMHFRIYASPRKVYMKDKDSGVELLYVSGWNNNLAYINPNGFPWVNVSFDINSPRVRADGHHPVTHAGFTYIAELMKGTERVIASHGESLEKYVSIAGDFTWNGRSCIKLILEDPDFKYSSYTCKQSETLLALCERLTLNEYMVMQKNNMGYGAKVYSGLVLQLPKAFAKKVELFIDKQTYMPILEYVYDEKGLLEKFEFRNVKLNPVQETNEWTTQCASYGF